MAFSMFSGDADTEPTPPATNAADPAELLQKQQQEIEKLNQRIQEQTRYHNKQLDMQNQKVELLRSQLAETVRPAAAVPAAPADTDDWLSIISGTTPTQAAPPVQGQPITEDKARALFQQEIQRQQQAVQQEMAAVQQLNERFATEYPELNQNEAAKALIRNQFQNLAALRPDLSAQQRYDLAIQNSMQLLPQLQPAVQQREQANQQVRKRNQQANGYMPVQNQGVPTSPVVPDNVNPLMDTRTMAQKLAARKKEMDELKRNYARMQMGG